MNPKRGHGFVPIKYAASAQLEKAPAHCNHTAPPPLGTTLAGSSSSITNSSFCSISKPFSSHPRMPFTAPLNASWARLPSSPPILLLRLCSRWWPASHRNPHHQRVRTRLLLRVGTGHQAGAQQVNRSISISTYRQHTCLHSLGICRNRPSCPQLTTRTQGKCTCIGA